jgi:HipA-like protein
MARALDVYLDHERLGHLVQDDDGQISFGYAAAWLEKDGSFAISHSLPLRAERFLQRACKGFFGGLLAEEGNRKVIARILKISDKNDFATFSSRRSQRGKASSPTKSSAWAWPKPWVSPQPRPRRFRSKTFPIF